jgi:tetratricopeptide (TPR) repeat protein
VGEHIEAGQWSALEEYLEAIWPTLERMASRSRKPARVSEPVRIAVEELARHYGSVISGGGSNAALDRERQETYRGKLASLETRSLSLAVDMDWPEIPKELSYAFGSIHAQLGDFGEAEKHLQWAVALPGHEQTSYWAVEELGALWEERDPSLAAYLYRWATRLSPDMPAIPFAHLYQALVRAGRRDEVNAEFQECARREPKTIHDVIQMAAAKQALGSYAEADALWDRCNEMLEEEGSPLVRISKHHIEIARAIGR